MRLEETLLFYCSRIYQQYGLIPVFGAELEFYVDNSDLVKCIKDNDSFKLVPEVEVNQFELQFFPLTDPVLFIKRIAMAKDELNKIAQERESKVYFQAKPFNKSLGSGFHLHVNLLAADGSNVFERIDEKESLYLLYSIAGLLKHLRESMIFFAPHISSYQRYRKSMYTPTKISWGNNNRTAALRIISRENDVRRIEHRVPGADADPLAVTTAIIVSIFQGLEEKLLPKIEQVYGNAFDKQYKLTAFPKKLDTASKYFAKSKYKELFYYNNE